MGYGIWPVAGCCKHGNGSFGLLKMHRISFLAEDLSPSEELLPSEELSPSEKLLPSEELSTSEEVTF